MPNWYTSREAVKRAASVLSSDRDSQIDRIIEAASRQVDLWSRRRFIPETKTRLYRWPSAVHGQGSKLWLDADLLSVTALKAKAQDTTPTTIAAADYFLEPNNSGPPYYSIEIDLSSTAAFESGDTPQRSISVEGSWGYANAKQAGGTVSSGLATDVAATSMVCSDGSKIDVGDTLLIQSEQVFVSERSNAQVGTEQITSARTADKAEVTIPVTTGTNWKAGETILIDSERMYIQSITGNNLTVIRAYDGTVLAAHTNATAVHSFRTLTITRAINGTAAATHADATAIDRYRPPLDITELCLAEALAAFAQEGSGWGRIVGTGDGARELDGRGLSELRSRVINTYQRLRYAAI